MKFHGGHTTRFEYDCLEGTGAFDAKRGRTWR
jgi:hypothetical protein